MDIPLQVSFKNMDHSDAVEARVREKAAKLEQYFSHLTSCRVVIEAPHRHHHKGKIYHVKIEMGVPRKSELVVSNETERNHAHEDVYVAIRDAFDTASRQLQAYVGKMEGKMKRREQRTSGRLRPLPPWSDHSTAARMTGPSGRVISIAGSRSSGAFSSTGCSTG